MVESGLERQSSVMRGFSRAAISQAEGIVYLFVYSPYIFAPLLIDPFTVGS